MNGFTFSPALGWVADGLLAAGLAVLAILEIVLFVRRRASSDETVWACIRRTLMLLIVAVMVLTPSVVSGRALCDRRLPGRQFRGVTVR